MKAKRNNQRNTKSKKIFNNIKKYLLIIICIILIVYSLMYNFNDIFFNKKEVNLGSITLLTESDSDSMKPLITETQLIITKKERINKIDIGDIIAYYNINSREENNIKIQTVKNIKQDNGRTYIITKGENYMYSNNEEVEDDEIVGTVIVKIPILGLLAKLLQMKLMLIVYLAIIVFLIVQKYKKEKAVKKIIEKQDRQIKRRNEKLKNIDK